MDEYDEETRPDMQMLNIDHKKARPIICNYNDMQCGKSFKKQIFL